jgi:hypothetical protein
VASRRLHALISGMSDEEAAELEARLEGQQAATREEVEKETEEAAQALHDRLFKDGRGRGDDKPTHAAVIPPASN